MPPLGYAASLQILPSSSVLRYTVRVTDSVVKPTTKIPVMSTSVWKNNQNTLWRTSDYTKYTSMHESRDSTQRMASV